MRQTQGAMICPNCGKLISVGEERCPFCGAWRPGLYGYAPVLQRLFGRQLDMIALIVTSCIVLYVVALALQPDAIFHMQGLLSFLSPGPRALAWPDADHSLRRDTIRPGPYGRSALFWDCG